VISRQVLTSIKSLLHQIINPFLNRWIHRHKTIINRLFRSLVRWWWGKGFFWVGCV